MQPCDDVLIRLKYLLDVVEDYAVDLNSCVDHLDTLEDRVELGKVRMHILEAIAVLEGK